MNKKSLLNISKYISFILRHEPEEIIKKLKLENNYIVIDAEGYVFVNELIKTINIKYKNLDFNINELKEIIKTDNKQRYSFNQDDSKIRANQGHSTKMVNLQLEEKTPPEVLYHGTAVRFLEPIKKEGLKTMSRHYVHLSDNLETATQVGKRHGEVFIIKIDTRKMITDGFKFYLSENNVWLSKNISNKYFLNLKEN